ncbi:XRE family transcriptional regulator [Paenibacillus alkaliterrae]|uniref:helix-turn-helix domain-containing protein n=1 Tax=Paenibacillus alkaliterrae TaxID=320909 RepID=UPI001F2254D3|nr:XRE family transcriptional regulator [Paenibacillus alkaliterrae]MCF2938548.1 XRE family transcriptional regulator [Paenibacillus alkaliterrae]
MDLGKKIRKIRKEQNRNLEDIANACGFTKSLLSKIENGKTVPPIGTLIKIAEALGTKISVLLDDHDQGGTVHTTKEMSLQKLVKTEKGYSFSALAVERQEKLMQPFFFIAKKGETPKRTVSHVGEEFIYVLEGKMKYKVGNVDYTLSPGDSLYFDSLEDHAFTPISEEVKYLSVFSSNSKSE